MDHLDQRDAVDQLIDMTSKAAVKLEQWKARCLAAESYIEAVKSPSISQTEVWKDQNRRRKEWLKLKREMDET